VEAGIGLLKYASSKGYTRASYALGLALRDGQPDVASMYMKDAADKGYIPALQEIWPSRKMKAKYGEPKADELRLHLDPLCLNRLLSRYYVQCAALREANTSHCWNPLCGRWAFKATAPAGTVINLMAHAHHHHHHNHPVPLGNPEDPPIRRGSDSSSNNGPVELDGASVAAAAAALAAAGGASASSSSSSSPPKDVKVSRMKMCSRCCRAKYCSKLCQVYDWRSGRHKMECQFL
jgi:TPR repeat protein